MGKGDKKTKKGKIIAGTYGNSRKRKANKTIVSAPKKSVTKKTTTKKTTAKKTTTKKTATTKKADSKK